MQVRKRSLFILMGLLSTTLLWAQQGADEKDDSWKDVYRATATKINDLVDTRLDVKFDYDKSYLYGKAWITLKPHFYPTDSVALDAKGMDIHQVAIVKDGKTEPLKYDYDGMVLNIHLGKTYKYTTNADGSLSNKQLFCELGSDGMTLDNEGNVYLTGNGVTVYNKDGKKIDHIKVPSQWTANLCFGGKNKNVLFITASESVYTIDMRVRGVE